MNHVFPSGEEDVVVRFHAEDELQGDTGYWRMRRESLRRGRHLCGRQIRLHLPVSSTYSRQTLRRWKTKNVFHNLVYLIQKVIPLLWAALFCCWSCLFS